MIDTDRSRVAISDVTSTLTTDFDLPALLQTVVEHARSCFDAYSAVIVLLDERRTLGEGGLHIVAEATRTDASADWSLNTSGPALISARDGAVSLVTDLALAEDTRWPDYRSRAVAAGLRGVRAFPLRTPGAAIGSMIVHTEQPWGNRLPPGDFGQILADLTAVALSAGNSRDRRDSVAGTVDAVLEGTILVTTAVGIIAEHFALEVIHARHRLSRLARSHDVTVTEYARTVVDAQNRSPRDPGATGVFDTPPELQPPRHIDARG
ncbi:GAF domain-containing protein [Williamsia sp. 1135]|uniref:GAF domain-containing protein n=1 Tax=Williamsia sp. 1135 TaxID=1889262 RepID=UPI00118059F6|nr:GAF domain-containing protein [Williamsia sp. 1135]